MYNCTYTGNQWHLDQNDENVSSRFSVILFLINSAQISSCNPHYMCFSMIPTLRSRYFKYVLDLTSSLHFGAYLIYSSTELFISNPADSTRSNTAKQANMTKILPSSVRCILISCKISLIFPDYFRFIILLIENPFWSKPSQVTHQTGAYPGFFFFSSLFRSC